MPTPDRPVLLTTQKNDLFLRLQNKGFPPEDFILTEDGSSANLKHRSAIYGCTISVGSFLASGAMGALDTYTVPFHLFYSPGRPLLQEDHYYSHWGNLLNGFMDWIDCLATQLQAPDLWATVSGDMQLIRVAAYQDTQSFTPDEQLQVKKALKEIKAYLIKSHNLSGTRLAAVEARLNYLEQSATRMSRKDWLHIAIGVLANIATTIALGGDDTRELFRFAGQIIKQILGTALYLATPH